MIQYKQLSVSDIFQDCQNIFDDDKPRFISLVEMYGNNSRKITCDYYIDDKAVLPAMVNA